MKKGEHKGINRGFGVAHILSEHTNNLKEKGLSCDGNGVISYVMLILQSNAQIFSEFSSVRGFHRPIIVSSKVGTIILEQQRINGETVYSIVTAFARTTPFGVKIGTMK